MIRFDTDELASLDQHISIKVIGVGGAGGNMINSMVDAHYNGIEFIAVTTDAQALKASKAQHKIQLGVKATKGLGSGANPEVGRRAAEEDMEKVLAAIQDAQVVFLAGGLGGGTGSGALPAIAQAFKDKNLLLIVVVTTPFSFEGKRRMKIAQEAMALLKNSADTLIIIPNQKLLDIVDSSVSMIKAFEMINDVLGQSVKSIADIIEKPGHINVDFADVRSIMKDKGMAVMGTGRASGEDRARQAALRAIASPLLENMSIAGASGILLNVTGPSSMGIHEIRTAAEIIHEQVQREDANIIFGSVIDDSLQDEMVVTVVATGFLPEKPKEKEPEIHVKPTFLDRSRVAPSAPMQASSAKEAATSEITAAPVESSDEDSAKDLEMPAYLRKNAKDRREVSR